MNNTFAKTITKKEISKIVEKLENHSIKIKSKYMAHQFFYKDAMISIYNSNKIVIQSKINIDNIIIELGLNFNYKVNTNKKYEIGSDETGVGDLIGGLVVCCVKVSNITLKKLSKFKITDSKKVNDKYILEIYDELIKLVDYKIISLSPKKYNILIKKYNNSHIIKAILHNEAHSYFNSTDSCRIIDMFSTTNKKYYEYLETANAKKIEIDIFEIKAENKYISVALASIIARGYFLKQIEKMEKKINMKIPLGAWNEKIRLFCLDFIKKYGKEALNEIIKHDFKVDLL